MKRKDFLLQTVTGFSGAFLLPGFLQARTAPDPTPYKAEIVREFVGAGHNNLSKVQEMLNDYPNLLFCSHDWSNGDFESALEAAGHVGDKEIAEFLISKGARPNIFVLTMLGKTQLVQPILETYPNLIQSLGAHGYTLLHHAQRGGTEAEPLLHFLMENGLKESRVKVF